MNPQQITELLSSAAVLSLSLGALILSAVQVLRGRHLDAALHEVGHAMVLSLGPGSIQVRISGDRSGAAAMASHDVDDDVLRSEAARPWIMLVCLAGHAAEARGGRGYNRIWLYRAMLNFLTGHLIPNSDSAKWNTLARLELCSHGAKWRMAGIAARRRSDMAALTEFFELNERLLMETARHTVQNGGEMDWSQLEPIFARVQCTEKISRAIEAAASSQSSLADSRR